MTEGKRHDHDRIIAFITELKRVAPAFRWFVDNDGAILGRYIELTRIKPFSPITAVLFFDTEKMEHDAHKAVARSKWMSIVWDLEVACDKKNRKSVLREAVLTALWLKDT